jgi:hypothetical protein
MVAGCSTILNPHSPYFKVYRVQLTAWSVLGKE